MRRLLEMPSRRQRSANRKNALRSTGPRTPAGLIRASRNATKHGLSRPLDQVDNARIIQRLTSAIESEGIQSTVAYDLAIKIMEFERNVDRQRQIHEKRISGKLVDAVAIMDCEYEHDPMRIVLEGFAAGRLHPELSEAEETIRDGAKFLVALHRKRLASKIHAEGREPLESVRYLRRASNQLIKALKRLPCDEAGVFTKRTQSAGLQEMVGGTGIEPVTPAV